MPPIAGGSTIAAAESPDAFAVCQRLASALLPAARLRALLEAAEGSPQAALDLAARPAAADPALGLTPKQAQRLKEALDAPPPDPKLIERAAALGASVVTYLDPAYPASLQPLPDSPPLLFVRGALHPDDRFSIAIVGSRRATLYGREQATRFAQACAERGLCVVSGGAAGIDTAAHQGALNAGGRTVSVLACGVDIVYPAMNRGLFARIAESGGAVISEFPMGTTPEPWRFPTRNRIIAGIARATVVVESPEDSGALITARNAAEYGRDVWVVPGPVDTGRSRGGHRLIQDGAALADSPDDILFALGLQQTDTPRPKETSSPQLALTEAPAPAAPAPPPADLSPDEAALLARFDLTPRHLDEASALAGLSAPQATVAATLLEMKSLLRRLPGNLFVRNL